jgi:hypothetical protein
MDKMIKKERKKSRSSCGSGSNTHKKTVRPKEKADLMVAAPAITAKGGYLKSHSRRLAETSPV